jgi:GNAT superfamily N-acetyltransferase
MTDFATDPEHRRASLAAHLLAAMEADARQDGVKTAFTIARAVSYGINIMFARAGYAFGGTLVNNTNISGRVQSMNIWYKPLSLSAPPNTEKTQIPLEIVPTVPPVRVAGILRHTVWQTDTK